MRTSEFRHAIAAVCADQSRCRLGRNRTLSDASAATPARLPIPPRIVAARALGEGVGSRRPGDADPRRPRALAVHSAPSASRQQPSGQ